MANDRQLTTLNLKKVPIGTAVRVPHSVFPSEERPQCGYWEGKVCSTCLGGDADVGIKCLGEPVFTRPSSEVAEWVVA